MDNTQPSVTALVNCFARAYHSINSKNKIFDDFLARDFFTKEEYDNFSKNIALSLHFFNPELAKQCSDNESLLACAIQTRMGQTLSRSKYTEDTLENEIENGVKQYIILGSGFDTFAFRRPDLMEKISVYEIDYPSTQNYKLQKIKEIGWDIPKNLHFISTDFSKENLGDILNKSSYNPEVSSFYSWLGVTLYLSKESIFSTLENISKISESGSSIIFDYIDTDAFIPEKASPNIRRTIEIVKRIGEPIESGLNPLELEKDFLNIGFELKENISPEEIDKRYFSNRNDRYYAAEHMHYAYAKIL